MSSNYIEPLHKQRYSGSKVAIVIGIDVGTTFSGVSYAVLRPGQVPRIQPVTRFSDQSTGDYKIPSIIYYDRKGVAKAIGAATMKSMVIREAEQQHWFKAEHFKMHLRPSGQKLETYGLKLGELPPGKTAEEVMSDFLRYLVDETSRYISATHINENELWNKVKDEAVYVHGHPNGWSGYTQQRYRSAAVKGGLVPDTNEGYNRIKFVTEGEASALSCLRGGLGPDLKRGLRFMIADAGGGTVDMTTFEVVETSPIQLKECTAPDCRFAGSIFVNMRGKDLLRRRLADSKYGDEDNISALISDEFEPETKAQFSGDGDGLLRVGGRRENDALLDISGGFLLLRRDDLAHCFEHSVTEVVKSIREQFMKSRSDTKTTPVWLVGGFGNSAYLQRELRRAFDQSGTRIQTPDTSLSKAVANGTILHFLDGTVVARVCPTTYGTDCYTRYNRLRSDHRERPDLVEHETDGDFIGPIFDPIAEKGSSIEVMKTFSCSYKRKTISRASASRCNAELFCYDGDLPAPYWYNENKEKFKTIFRLEADLSSLWDTLDRGTSLLEVIFSSTFRSYKYLVFDIELKFGTTEVEARIKWEEDGVVKYGPAKILWLE
ncbi:hypothetical protein ACEPAI_6883 [Sanghuangporus weigelae]